MQGDAWPYKPQSKNPIYLLVCFSLVDYETLEILQQSEHLKITLRLVCSAVELYLTDLMVTHHELLSCHGDLQFD